MFKLQQNTTKTLLAIHGWSGVVLGLLLYAVICTGVAAVFASEINNWASPLAHHESSGLPQGLDAVVRRYAPEVDPQFHEEVAAYRSAGGRLLLFYHRHETGPDGKPTERGVEFEVDPQTWQLLARREGWVEDIAEQRRPSAVADFLVDLHVRLHIPNPYGLFITGLLGLAMMVAAVTGLFVHRHLLKELFTLRLGREPMLRSRDMHVVAGSWNLPFAFILAFTGSFFSFASTVGFPLLANAKFGGDQEQLIETLYGAPRTANAQPTALSNLDAMIADSHTRSGVAPTFVAVEGYGRADALVTTFSQLPENELIYSSQLYNGATGQHLQEKPPLGQVPSFGATLVGLMYPLHFGHFAGAASKAVWVALGFAGAYVSLTGMLLWMRRREEQRAWRIMARVVHYVGYGLPLALVGAPYAFFALRDSTTPAVTLQGITFLAIAAVAALATVAISNLDRLRRAMIASTAVALLGLPFMRMASGGPGWLDAWQAELGAVLAVDMAVLVMGIACLWVAYPRRAAAAAAAQDRAIRAIDPKAHSA